MSVKAYLLERENALINRSSQALLKIFATPDGQQLLQAEGGKLLLQSEEGKSLLQSEQGKEYLEITTRTLPVIRDLLKDAPNDVPLEEATLPVTEQTQVELSAGSLEQEAISEPAVETSNPAFVASDTAPKRKPLAKVVEEIFQTAPSHTLSVDQILEQAQNRGHALNRNSLRWTLSARDEFASVDKGRGVWTLKSYALRGIKRPKLPAHITPLGERLKRFFVEGEFSSLSQPATIHAMWHRFDQAGHPDVFVDLETAVWLFQWVGNPIGGDDFRSQKHNVSKLFRMNNYFGRNEKGHYGLRASLNLNAALIFDPEETSKEEEDGKSVAEFDQVPSLETVGPDIE